MASRFSTLLFFLALVCPALAIPVELKQDSTLKAISRGKTLFEVKALPSEQVQKLKVWFSKSRTDAKISSKQNKILGLPVPLEVTSAIGSHWKSEPKILASLFASRLREALSEKTATWSVDGQVVPLQETRVVTLNSYRAEDAWEVQSSAPDIVSVESLGEGKFRLAGLKKGRANLVAVNRKGESLPELPVQVKPWAARLGQGPGRFVFWGPGSPERVRRSLKRWLSARSLVGANLSMEQAESKEDAPPVFKLSASAPGAIPVEKTVTLKVEERGSSAFTPAKTVLLSNHPERVVSDGVLFERTAPSVPFRFMWHHRNDPEGPERHLILQINNPQQRTRRFRMLWFGYGPSPDEIHVGHTANLDYCQAALLGQGEEFVLPAGGSRTVEIRRVKAGQTMSGMAYFHELSGGSGPVRVKVLATQAGRDEFPTEFAQERDPGRTASGVFPADIQTDFTHTVGGPYTYIEFGGEPYETDVEEGHPSYGNFATVYRTRLMVQNPSDEEREVFIGFASGGGAARGVLAIEGELYDLPMGVTGDGIPVTSYALGPGEIRQLDVELLPQAGSNYPVRVVVRSQFERRENQVLEAIRPLVPAIP